jgi:hypothetical protein
MNLHLEDFQTQEEADQINALYDMKQSEIEGFIYSANADMSRREATSKQNG